MNKDICFKFDRKNSKIEDFKEFVKEKNCKVLTVDLSSLNAFEALKFAVLSSAYHFQKYPSGKLKFINNSTDINSLIADFSLNNMEFV
ncbi:hypothetical protein BHV42_08470 [Candidatus Melainabacteria bacterium MEL.A1]|jgi:hypothetical protein|nr:hypothetical protein BHV42_08470 [Candidatus Melainabacteria bacterium MEL.A1]CCX80251.1 unknown [Clostridium sp. CAG:715]DAA83991.1 MAG TPA: hypothetical protein CPT82_05160 [Candidatus Gastranaerophilales bacterium HUM_2]